VIPEYEVADLAREEVPEESVSDIKSDNDSGSFYVNAYLSKYSFNALAAPYNVSGNNSLDYTEDHTDSDTPGDDMDEDMDEEL